MLLPVEKYKKIFFNNVTHIYVYNLVNLIVYILLRIHTNISILQLKNIILKNFVIIQILQLSFSSIVNSSVILLTNIWKIWLYPTSLLIVTHRRLSLPVMWLTSCTRVFNKYIAWFTFLFYFLIHFIIIYFVRKLNLYTLTTVNYTCISLFLLHTYFNFYNAKHTATIRI